MSPANQLLLWLAWMGALIALSHQAPSLLMIAPSVVHIGVEVGVVLQVEGDPYGLSGSIYFQNKYNRKKCSPEVPFHLEPNSFVQRVTLQVTHEFYVQCALTPLKTGNYIQLVAHSPQLHTSNGIQTLDLPWRAQRRHLFLQTDKPIYNPGEVVNFRVFRLDHKLQPSSEPVTITVENSQGVPVQKTERKLVESPIHYHVSIPNITAPGVWSIKAKFAQQDSITTTEFEVKEHVLPHFEVTIVPERKYILLSEQQDSDLHIDLQAKFFYGKGLSGTAYVQFGVSNDNRGTSYIPGLEQQVFVTDGLGSLTLNCRLLLMKLAHPQQNLIGATFCIKATVREATSGELVEQELASVKFVRSPYSVNLSKTKGYFVPGVPFEVLATVLFPDGTPVPNLPVVFATQIIGAESPSNTQVITNDHGAVTYKTDMPSGAKGVTFAITAGTKSPATVYFTAKAMTSPSGFYMIIDNPSHQDLHPRDTLTLGLNHVGPDTFSNFYYMVLNKGNIISIDSMIRGSNSKISMLVTSSLIPSFRIVAFFRTGDEIVANSIKMDVSGRCKGRLEVNVLNAVPLRPQDTLNLVIRADDKSSVSFAATDASVYALSQKNRLTQDKVFQAMERYDLGCTVGSGENTLGVFADAGLSLRAGTLEIPGCRRDDSWETNLPPFQTEVRERPQGGKEIEDSPNADFQVRSFLPESWLWKTYTVKRSYPLSVTLPDSITTWEIQAVSVSAGKGICISEPLRIPVFQNFHLSLRLPYSVKHFEQVELRPVLYNYYPDPVNASVYLEPVQGICSPATMGKTLVEVPGFSAVAVPFVLIPIGTGRVPITVTADDAQKGGDKVTEILQIEAQKQFYGLAAQNYSCQTVGLAVDVSSAIELRPDAYAHDESLVVRGHRQLQHDVTYEVCIWRQPGVPISGVAIADITLLSGFQPNKKDLNQSMRQDHKADINKWEIQGRQLVLHFSSVPESGRRCITFGAKQLLPVEELYSASATLHGVYEPDKRCTIFYSAPNTAQYLSLLCSGGVCQCAAGGCPHLKQTLADAIKERDRMEFACNKPRVDYGFWVRVEHESQESAFRIYEATILGPLKFSTDVGVAINHTRRFVTQAKCQIRLAVSRLYLLMGRDGETRDSRGRPQYLLDLNSWVEELPLPQQCQATMFRGICSQLWTFSAAFVESGCPT